DWSEPRRLDFEPPDRATFRCLDLAYEAARIGRGAPTWLNAANEVTVAAFLSGRIGWSRIAEVLSEAMTRHDGRMLAGIDDVLETDREARRSAESIVAAVSR
ncbi:MAG: 1-deoxy-D-xylulose-5-phosphate reductoisomerase, partial [Actinobacteria bacterium]|nr:1-deoxy-D-xylulose-5-phosphate reductoisomerase [Actinomycetota bacterium]